MEALATGSVKQQGQPAGSRSVRAPVRGDEGVQSGIPGFGDMSC